MSHLTQQPRVKRNIKSKSLLDMNKKAIELRNKWGKVRNYVLFMTVNLLSTWSTILLNSVCALAQYKSSLYHIFQGWKIAFLPMKISIPFSMSFHSHYCVCLSSSRCSLDIGEHERSARVIYKTTLGCGTKHQLGKS